MTAPAALRPARTTAEKMIKVDHAGENGAVNIYRAQTLAARIRAPSLVKQLTEFQRHEEEHRTIFRDYLAKIGVRRCVSYHFSGLGGFSLGFITGLIGPKAIAATTFAVEHVVLRHLEEQLEYLRSADPEARDCVLRIHDDERAPRHCGGPDVARRLADTCADRRHSALHRDGHPHRNALKNCS